jgi:hypothetical protein
MKRTIQTIITAAFVVLITSTFAFAAAADHRREQLPLLPPRVPDHGRSHHRL